MLFSSRSLYEAFPIEFNPHLLAAGYDRAMAELVRMLTNFGRGAAAIVLPSPCVVCGDDLPWRDRRGSCCGACWGGLAAPPGNRCSICSLSLDTAAPDARCGACVRQKPPFEWIESYGPYHGGLDRVISAFKFEGHHFLAAPLAELLAEGLARRDAEFDVLCGVPMESKRERARGYNQAELLARELSRITRIQHQRNALRRAGTSGVQSTLPREERRRNVRGKFEPAGDLGGKAVLIVDDICTTGETLRECARVLRRAGVGRVAAVTIARA